MLSDMHAYFDHPTARWFFTCDASGLKRVTIQPILGAVPVAKQGGLIGEHAAMLADVLDGNIACFALPIKISGSPFQMRVWHEISRIPHRETISYTELAARAGNVKAVRAAASACGANPVPVAIPCHRVLRADGSLGGFAFGLELKQRMLEFEQLPNKMVA